MPSLRGQSRFCRPLLPYTYSLRVEGAGCPGKPGKATFILYFVGGHYPAFFVVTGPKIWSPPEANEQIFVGSNNPAQWRDLLARKFGARRLLRRGA